MPRAEPQAHAWQSGCCCHPCWAGQWLPVLDEPLGTEADALTTADRPGACVSVRPQACLPSPLVHFPGSWRQPLPQPELWAEAKALCGALLLVPILVQAQGTWGEGAPTRVLNPTPTLGTLVCGGVSSGTQGPALRWRKWPKGTEGGRPVWDQWPLHGAWDLGGCPGPAAVPEAGGVMGPLAGAPQGPGGVRWACRDAFLRWPGALCPPLPRLGLCGGCPGAAGQRGADTQRAGWWPRETLFHSKSCPQADGATRLSPPPPALEPSQARAQLAATGPLPGCRAVGAERVLGRGEGRDLPAGGVGSEAPPRTASLLGGATPCPLGGSGPIMSARLSGQRWSWWCSGWGGATSLGHLRCPLPTQSAAAAAEGLGRAGCARPGSGG